MDRLSQIPAIENELFTALRASKLFSFSNTSLRLFSQAEALTWT